MPELAAVFGGTGFLGRRIVSKLLANGFLVRAVSRHPDRAREIFGSRRERLEVCRADMLDEGTLSAVVDGATHVVNAVSLYRERGPATFESLHVEAARRLAALCLKESVRGLVQISGLGANPKSDSRYISARGRGEIAVQGAFDKAVLVRPAVMFGPDDSFFTKLVDIVKRLPIVPLFGRGETKLQPVFVEDVAVGVARILGKSGEVERLYETAGPHVYSYRELVEEVAAAVRTPRLLVPLPFGIWKVIATAAESISFDGLTLNQVELMEIDNVATRSDLPRLGVKPTTVEHFLKTVVDGQASA